MRALTLSRSELKFSGDYPEPQLASFPNRANELVKVRVLQAGICETDLQLIQGYMGFQGVLGHEFVGVAENGKFQGERVVGEINCYCDNCDFCESGKGNHCPHRSVIGILNHDGAFAEYLVIPEKNLHPVPDSISDDLATLVEPLAAAYQIPAQVSSHVDLNSQLSVVVLGDGRLGNLCAQVLKSHGCQVLVVGKHDAKLKVFQEIGLSTCRLEEFESPKQFDLAVDCTGSKSGLETAISAVRPKGTIVLKTTVAEFHEVSLAPIVIDELTMIGSRCGPFDKAIRALELGQVNLDNFVCGHYQLEDFEKAFQQAVSGEALKVILNLIN